MAVQLGLKVYLETDKWQVLQCLDKRASERRLLTRNINEASIHVVPMRKVRRPPTIAPRSRRRRVHTGGPVGPRGSAVTHHPTPAAGTASRAATARKNAATPCPPPHACDSIVQELSASFRGTCPSCRGLVSVGRLDPIQHSSSLE